MSSRTGGKEAALDAEEEELKPGDSGVENGLISIAVQSSGFLAGNSAAQISVNDRPIDLQKNDHKGMHIVLINPYTGEVDASKTFDTNKTSEPLDTFIGGHIPEGYIVAAASQDDCFKKLSEKAIRWFEKMGSKEIRKLKYRDSFAFTGVIGRNQVRERLSASTGEKVVVVKVFRL